MIRSDPMIQVLTTPINQNVSELNTHTLKTYILKQCLQQSLKTAVFGRLFLDCPKYSLEHCLIGLFIRYSDKSEENGSSLAFFHKFTFFSLTSSFVVDLFGPWGEGGGCNRTLRTPPPPPPMRLALQKSRLSLKLFRY